MARETIKCKLAAQERREMVASVDDNFIMSYPFNQKQAGYSGAPNFTPWSQQVNNLFTPSPAGLPFGPYPPYHPFHPFLIHQQNNFYNSNFTLPSIPLPFSAIQQKPALPSALKPPPKPAVVKRPSAPQEVIIISDDEDRPADTKPLVAVIKEKAPQPTRPQPADRPFQNFRQQKQVIQGKRQKEVRDTLEKKDPKTVKKPAKPEPVKEEEFAAKRKKICKERSGFRMNDHLRELMEVSRYREYRPDLIMVGPQFQAKINDTDVYEEHQEWLRDVREGLELRRHD